MPDREEFYQTVLDGLGRYLESHFIADVLDAIRRFPAAELHYALNKNQMASKKWLLDELHRAVGGRLGTVRILGGWYGVLAAMLLHDRRFEVDSVISVDIDPTCEPVANAVNRVHLDGARLMNACIATDRKPTDYTKHFDTVSMCFSKGLGAPVGSIVAGSADAMKRVHRVRKMFGGGLRQAGVLAAAALYALDHNVDRLADDHANARRLAEALGAMPGIDIDPTTVDTNLIFFNVQEPWPSAPAFVTRLGDVGVRCLAEGTAMRVRMVTNLDVSAGQIDDAIERIRGVVEAGP